MKHSTGKLSFNGDSGLDMQFGVPLSEIVLEAKIEPCTTCGADYDGTTGGVLDDVTVVDGVMTGNSTCIDCLRDQGDPIVADFDRL